MQFSEPTESSTLARAIIIGPNTFLGMIALVAAIPANKKEIIKPKCTITCDDTEKIICAKGDGYETAFINECVLKKSNCENQRSKLLILTLIFYTSLISSISFFKSKSFLQDRR